MAYGADHDGESQYPELNGGAYARNPYVLYAYGISKQMMYCPSCPSGTYDGMATTYTFAQFGLHDVPLGMKRDGPSKRDKIKEEWEALGPKYLYILCHVHDQLDYWPSNPNPQATPFLLAVKADGAHYSGFWTDRQRFFPLRGIPPWTHAGAERGTHEK